MKKNKEYAGVMRLHKDIDDATLNGEIKKFTGRIMQLPPVKSRVKRQEREREVFSFNVLERGEKDRKNVLFSCEVEAGTYVRKLVSDMGKSIGGAHMLELRRTKAGIFGENNKEFKKGNEKNLRAMLIPAEIISEIMPVVQIKEQAIKQLLTGKPLFKDDLAEELKTKDEQGHIAVFFKDKFIEVARVVNEGDILAKPEFVMN